jgi:hypothetical protein
MQKGIHLDRLDPDGVPPFRAGTGLMWERPFFLSRVAWQRSPEPYKRVAFVP